MDLGVWGPPDVGKTVFLAAAIKALRDLGYWVREPLQLNARDPRLDSARVFLRDIQSILADRQLPGNTVPRSLLDLHPFSLNIAFPDSGEGRDGRFHRLDVSDAAGEYCRETADHFYYQLLCQTKGILMIVDGTKRQVDNNATFFGGAGYSFLIHNLVSQLGKEHDRHRFPHYVAICITKADSMAAYRNDPYQAEKFYTTGERETNQKWREAELAQVIGTDALNELKENFDWKRRVHIFLTSSVGWIRKIHTMAWESNLDGKQLKRTSEWQTYHVADAVLWLLDRIEYEKLHSSRRFFLSKNYIERERTKNVTIMERYVGEKSLNWNP